MVEDIIATAVKEGQRGNRYFTYHTGYSRAEMFNIGNVTQEVREKTEGTVVCCERGDYGYKINFEIVG